MNHKRGRPKNSRSGCLRCKPNKSSGIDELASAKPSDKKRLMSSKSQIKTPDENK